MNDRKRKGVPHQTPQSTTDKGNEPFTHFNTVQDQLITQVKEQEDVFVGRLAEAESLGDLTVADQVLVLEELVAYATQLPTIRKLTLYRVIEKQVGFGPDVLKKCEEEFVKALEMWSFLSEGEGVSNDCH
jgi:hypothetical protein